MLFSVAHGCKFLSIQFDINNFSFHLLLDKNFMLYDIIWVHSVWVWYLGLLGSLIYVQHLLSDCALRK